MNVFLFRILNAILRFILVIFSVATLSSCDEFVTVDLPTSQLSGPTVFEDVATADAALGYIYAKLRDEVLLQGNSSGIGCLMGHYADELDYYSSGNLAPQFFYQNNVLPTNGTIRTLWNGTYQLIYATNAVIEGVQQSSSLSVADKERLLGEALFLRAYLHFYLVNMFGEIPYVISTDYVTNASISKSTVQDVYSFISTDLQQSATLIPTTYVSFERTRPNRSVVYAFLARVKLYSEDWSQAIQYADLVIGSTSMYQLAPVANVFLKESTGTLLQLRPQFTGANTLEAQNYTFTSAPPPTFALTPALVSSFEVGDIRRTNWIQTVTNGVDSWYHAYKYKAIGTTGSSVEYSILLRLEELYLIRAEAKVQMLDLTGGAEDLNVIRNRSGLGDTPFSSQPDLLGAIHQERRHEFFTELGHRWFDLKRSGTATSVLGVVKPGWDTKDLLLPLPESELLLNPNLLPQNLGY